MQSITMSSAHSPFMTMSPALYGPMEYRVRPHPQLTPMPFTISLPQSTPNKTNVLGFMSMLGTVIQTVQLPRIPYLGWSLSLPDYIHCVASQKDSESRKEVLFCRLPAKIVSQFTSAEVGYLVGGKLFRSVKSYLPRVVAKLPPSALKSVSGLAALFALTPIMEGSLSDKLVGVYRNHRLGEHTL